MKKRIFVAGLLQESNTFSPVISTYNDFNIIEGEDMLQTTHGVDLLLNEGYEVIPSIYANAVPNGILALESYQKLIDEIIKKLPRDGSIDGVFLVLHGAMEVEFIGSAETLLVSKIREIVGPNVPISAAFDLHGNNTYTLARITNIMYGYRTAPHTDHQETRERAAKLLIKALNENVLPWSEIVRVPIMLPGENMMTETGPGKKIIAALNDVEKADGVWCASYFAGMPWVDCAENGSAIVISGIGNPLEGRKAAIKLANFVWDLRNDFEFQGLSLETDEALEFAASKNEYPVIISDSADNVTAGSAGDNGYFLQKIIDKGLKKVLVAAIVDPIGVDKCFETGENNILNITVGGQLDVNSAKVGFKNAKVISLTRDGLNNPLAAVIRTENIDVLLFNRRLPVASPEIMAIYGLNAADYNYIVVKQGYLTPPLYDLAKHYVMALTPGNSLQDLSKLPFKLIRRPMFPHDDFEKKESYVEYYKISDR